MALVALWKEDGLEQRELHEQLGVTSPTLTGVIDGLVRAGYVERKPHPEDGRVKQLFLTAEGRTLGARIDEQMALYQSWLLGDFTPEEIVQLQSLLRRITLKLEAVPALN
jgi:DNA-binding MarR family transcriptional regulator